MELLNTTLEKMVTNSHGKSEVTDLIPSKYKNIINLKRVLENILQNNELKYYSY